MSEQKICQYEGCNRVAKIRGYCQNHYTKLLYRGEFSNGEICQVEGCNKPVYMKHLCGAHYNYVNKRVEKFLDEKTHQIQFDELVKTLKAPEPRPTICEVEGCNGPVYNLKYCRKHYRVYLKERKHRIETNYEECRSLYDKLLEDRQGNQCIIPNCNDVCWRHHVFCPKHYQILKNFMDTKLIDYEIKKLIENDNSE